MGGFFSGLGAATAGAGQGAHDLGAQLRQQMHEHRENSLRLDALQREQLANRVAAHSRQYGGDAGEELGVLADEIHSAPQGADWLKYHQKVNQIVQKARAAQAAARTLGKPAGEGGGADATGLDNSGGIPPAQAPVAPPPFAGLMSPPAAAPSGQPAAQSPVNPVQGGAGAASATFPERPNSTSASTVQPVPPELAGAVGQLDALAAPVGGHAALPAGGPQDLLGPVPDFNRSINTFNASGYIDPVIEAELVRMTHPGSDRASERYMNAGGGLVFDKITGKFIQGPAAPIKPVEVSPGASLVLPSVGDAGKWESVFQAPNRPQADARSWQVLNETDAHGNVWQWRTNRETGETTDRTNLGKIGKPATPGSFLPIMDAQGRITDFFNPKTGAEVKPPGEGGRKAALPPAENIRRATIEGMIQDMGRLAELSERHKDKIGPVAGRITRLQLQTLGADDPEIAELFRVSQNLRDQLLRARSGAQINEAEYKRLSTLVPGPEQPYSTFKSNLNSFRKEWDRLAKLSTGGDLQLPPPPGSTGGKNNDPLGIR